MSLIPKKVIEYQRGIDRVSPNPDTLNNHKSIISNHKSEINNKKERYMDSVFLTIKEYEKLIKKFGESKAKDYIENLNNYIGSKGKKYKSHYFTILNWSKKDDKEKPKDQTYEQI